MKNIATMRVARITEYPGGRLGSIIVEVPVAGRTVAQVDADECPLDEWGRERRYSR